MDSSSDSECAPNKRRYSGKSRTTKWRKKKRREDAGRESPTTTDSDTSAEQQNILLRRGSTSEAHQEEVNQCTITYGANEGEASAQIVGGGPTGSTHQSLGSGIATLAEENYTMPLLHNAGETPLFPCNDSIENEVHSETFGDDQQSSCSTCEDSKSLLSADSGSRTSPHKSESEEQTNPGSSWDDSQKATDNIDNTSTDTFGPKTVSSSSESSVESSGSDFFPSASDWENLSSDELSSDLESFQAHYLEEEPQQNPDEQEIAGEEDVHAVDQGRHVNVIGNPDDGDDPDDSSGNDTDSSSSSSEDSEDENIEVATFVNNPLNQQVRLVNPLTVGEIVCLELACAVRHKKTFESIIDNFKNLNVLFGHRLFPESKTKLWSVISLNKSGIQFHIYCGRKDCGRYINRRDRINGIARCRCGYRIAIEKAKYFITLDLKTQLQYFLSIPGMWRHLQYPQHREKISPTGIEDVLDSALYQRLKQEGGPLSNPHNFSFIFNLDGCNPTKRGSLKLWPLYLRLNELPPEMRQKFNFPAAVYLDHVEPNFQSFLKPFVKQVRRLSNEGVNWKPDGVHEVNSKFIPLAFNVDSPVRYSILNMSKWDSAVCGCTYCTHQGVREAGSTRYPELHLDGIPPFQDRSHQGMIDAMIQAQLDNNLEHVQGHKGTSVLMLLRDLDLRDGQAEDDLHQDHEGSAAHITELLLTTEAARVQENMPYIQLVRAIDRRLLTIKTPSKLSRKPRSISKRAKYNGTEWRNWLFFYAVPCLLGLIRPEYLDVLASLSHGCYLLSQDSVEEEEIIAAERLLLRAGTSFERLFGVGRLRYNLHVTTKHKVRSVRNLGSPWAYSTYNFESLNQHMIGKVTSPKGAAMQVLTRIMLHMTVYAAQYDERLSEDVRLRVEEILNPYQLKRVLHIGRHFYLVGAGVERAVNDQEAQVLAREGIHTNQIVVYKSFLRKNTRFKSSAGQNENIKSDDSFIYTFQDTFCTIRSVCSFLDDNGEQNCGLFVTEHDVLQIVPVARHISILEDANADLHHFITLQQVRCPAVKMRVGNVVYAAPVPNCFEID